MGGWARDAPMLRSFHRRAAKVPQVMCQMGWENKITFINHPGVMAVSKLLELRYVTRPRANFTPETVERIAEYDEELARKAQIALDNGRSTSSTWRPWRKTFRVCSRRRSSSTLRARPCLKLRLASTLCRRSTSRR